MTIKHLTDDQFNLLTFINNTFLETGRRTDKLACNMNRVRINRQSGPPDWDNSHAAFIGLQLRDLGLVTTLKDQSAYARWDITPVGKAMLLEDKARRAHDKKAVNELPYKPKEYGIYDPEDGSFQYFGSLIAAEDEAAVWAKGEPGHSIHVVQVLHRVTAKLTVEKV
jgi:hypothetical protein